MAYVSSLPFCCYQEVQVCVVYVFLNCFSISRRTDGQQCDSLCISQQKSQRFCLSTVCVLMLTRQRRVSRGNISVYFTSPIQSQQIFDRVIHMRLTAYCCICNNILTINRSKRVYVQLS